VRPFSIIAAAVSSDLGATVIGTVGSADKAELARQHGCDHVILYRDEDPERPQAVEGGRIGRLADAVIDHGAALAAGDVLHPGGGAKHLGATVIGTVGSADKAELARQHGCDHVILYRELTNIPNGRRQSREAG
jgi:NADPH2:quinone reductase